MKILFYSCLLFLSFTLFPSCKKDKDTPVAKKVMMTKQITVVPGQPPFTVIYHYDADGQLVSYQYGTIAITKITRNTNGQIIKTTDTNPTSGAETGATKFYYDAAGKCIKKEMLLTSGAISFYYTYTYMNNMYVARMYNSTGTAGDYFENYYTADGKNIQSLKTYTASGTLKAINTHQYDTKPGYELTIPFSDISPVFPSANNLIAATYSVIPGATTNYNYTYTYNNDGYPVKRVHNNGTEVTFEYVTW